MATMLPGAPPPNGLISDVAGNILSAMTGHVSAWGFSPVKKVALVVIDGLGLTNLRDFSGHARQLSRLASNGGFALSSGLPSTTAAALASLTTGRVAGAHGLLGYQVRDPESGELVNHLKPFPAGIRAEQWQPLPTVFELLARESIPSLAVGESRFEGTDFSRAVLRGAEFSGSHHLSSHLSLMREFFDRHERGLCYLYWPSLDRVGHHAGVGSSGWLDALEVVDSWVGDLSESLGPDEAALVVADHGMVNVAADDQWVMPADHSLRADIELWGGEPRAVHLWLRDGVEHATFLSQLARWVDHRGVVVGRDEVVSNRLCGEVTETHAARIGDAVIFASDAFAFYDELTSAAASYQMVGQHGSGTTTETLIPCLPFGAWGAD